MEAIVVIAAGLAATALTHVPARVPGFARSFPTIQKNYQGHLGHYLVCANNSRGDISGVGKLFQKFGAYGGHYC
jgi:hypothetical protein